MEEMILYFTVLILTCLALYIWKKSGHTGLKQGKPIPGPTLLEGIRVFIKQSVNNRLHLYLPEWAQKFGKIMHVNIILRKVIFINDADTFRRLVRDTQFKSFTNDRPPTFLGKQYLNGCKDIILANNNFHLEQKRKILHNALKFYGDGRQEFEHLLTSLLQEKVKQLSTMETINFPRFLRNIIASVVSAVFTDSSSEDIWEKVRVIADFSDCIDKMFLIEFETVLQPFPFLRFVPGLKYKKLHNATETAIKNFHEVFFHPMKKTYRPDHKRGFIDELLSAQEDLKKQNHKLQLDDETIQAMLLDVGAAGYLSTSAFLTSLFLHLTKHQDIQARVYQEIQKVIGQAAPTFQHKQHMTYTEAVLLETFRYISVAPLLIPHMIKEDFVFDGYFFPKNSVLYMNAWYNHHREDVWGDPYTFRPERFLDSKGQLLNSDHPLRERLIFFGSGPRACPGENFAKARAFLITVFMLKHFEFVLDENNNLPSTDSRNWKSGTIICPDDFTCMIKRRCD